MSTPITKICRKCQVAKPLSAFYPAERKEHGVHSYCIECSKQANLNNYQRYLEAGKKANDKQIERFYAGSIRCF